MIRRELLTDIVHTLERFHKYLYVQEFQPVLTWLLSSKNLEVHLQDYSLTSEHRQVRKHASSIALTCSKSDRQSGSMAGGCERATLVIWHAVYMIHRHSRTRMVVVRLEGLVPLSRTSSIVT